MFWWTWLFSLPSMTVTLTPVALMGTGMSAGVVTMVSLTLTGVNMAGASREPSSAGLAGGVSGNFLVSGVEGFRGSGLGSPAWASDVSRMVANRSARC